MDKYEALLTETENEGVFIDEDYPFDSKITGLYINGNIALSNKLETTAEKSCILAEELGHHHTTVGDIIDLNCSQNVKQERQARFWAYNRQIGLQGLIRAYEAGCHNRYGVAEFLEVTEVFFEECISCYQDKYGTGVVVDNYYIMFIPNLQILKMV